jgi:hypothetical protein
MTTLLISADPAIGNPIADALQQTGEDVMWCRGPTGVDCTCAAVRGARCALTSGVDAVIVDSWLQSDQLDRGFRSARLVQYYEKLGLPVVVLVGFRDVAQTLHLGRQTITMSRCSDPSDVAAAARGAAMLGASRKLIRFA